MLTSTDLAERRAAGAARAAERDRARALSVARAAADDVGQRLAEHLESVVVLRALSGDHLRAAVVEALTYASEGDPADRLAVHVVGRASAVSVAECAAALSVGDWSRICADRARWQVAEGVPVDSAGVGAGVPASMVAVVPGRGPARDRTDAVLSAAVAMRRTRASSAAWVDWCAERGIGRTSAYRWWARAAAWVA